jgi:hypothetical protein
MESTVAALLLVTSAVVFSCIVVVYAVDAIQQSFDGNNPQVKIIKDLQSTLMNQTSLFNGTYPGITNPPQP